jgi:hypothetical protein
VLESSLLRRGMWDEQENRSAYATRSLGRWLVRPSTRTIAVLGQAFVCMPVCSNGAKPTWPSLHVSFSCGKIPPPRLLQRHSVGTLVATRDSHDNPGHSKERCACTRDGDKEGDVTFLAFVWSRRPEV